MPRLPGGGTVISSMIIYPDGSHSSTKITGDSAGSKAGAREGIRPDYSAPAASGGHRGRRPPGRRGIAAGHLPPGDRHRINATAVRGPAGGPTPAMRIITTDSAGKRRGRGVTGGRILFNHPRGRGGTSPPHTSLVGTHDAPRVR